MMRRPLSNDEELAVSRIAEMIVDNDRRRQLMVDLANATVESQTGGSWIAFHIAGYERPPYIGQRSFGVEGNTTDKDGAPLSIDLYMDQNERVLALEILKPGKGDIIAPDWARLALH